MDPRLPCSSHLRNAKLQVYQIMIWQSTTVQNTDGNSHMRTWTSNNVCIAFFPPPSQLQNLSLWRAVHEAGTIGFQGLALSSCGAHVHGLIWRQKPDRIPGQRLRFQNHVLKRFYFTLDSITAICSLVYCPRHQEGETSRKHSQLRDRLNVCLQPRHSILCHYVDCVSHI